ELEEKQAELKQLQEQALEIERLEQQLAAGEKARYVEPLQQRFARAERSYQEAVKTIEQLEQERLVLAEQLASAQQQWEQQQQLEPKRSALQLEQHELEGFVELSEQLRKGKEQLTEANWKHQ